MSLGRLLACPLSCDARNREQQRNAEARLQFERPLDGAIQNQLAHPHQPKRQSKATGSQPERDLVACRDNAHRLRRSLHDADVGDVFRLESFVDARFLQAGHRIPVVALGHLLFTFQFRNFRCGRGEYFCFLLRVGEARL
jgi:hypothetical protein